MPTTKICTKCNNEFKIEMYSKSKTGRDGRRCICKNCVKEYNKKHKAENKELHDIKYEEYRKHYRETHKAEKKKYDEMYRKVKRTERISKGKQYYQENKETFKIKAREYRVNNPDVFRVIMQRRKARTQELESTLTVEQWENIKETFNNKCAYCGKVKPLAQEHFMPVTKGGGHTLDNILPSCKSCNSSKNGKDFHEWYPTYKYYDKQREQKIFNHLSIL